MKMLSVKLLWWLLPKKSHAVIFKRIFGDINISFKRVKGGTIEDIVRSKHGIIQSKLFKHT